MRNLRALGVFVLLISLAPAAAQTATSVELPEGVTRLAVSPTSGWTAAMDERGKTVLLYSKLTSAGTLDGEIKLPVDGKPMAICHKPTKDGGVFAAADDQRTIH